MKSNFIGSRAVDPSGLFGVQSLLHSFQKHASKTVLRRVIDRRFGSKFPGSNGALFGSTSAHNQLFRLLDLHAERLHVVPCMLFL